MNISQINKRLLCAVAAWLFVIVSAACGDTRTVQAKPGLIELRIDAPAGADVSWESRQPLDLVIRTYEAGNVAIFCRHNAGRVVIVSDVIDWEARKRTKTTWLVDIDGESPSPPSPPDPEPPPPEPTRYGLDRVASEALLAVPAGSRSIAPAVASNFTTASGMIRAGGLRTIDAALEHVREANRAVFGSHRASWEPWLEKVGFAVDALQDAGKLKSVNDYADALTEIANGLQQ